MLRGIAVAAALCAVPSLALADGGKGELDWSRRVLIGHGQGAPDLDAPSIAVARLGAERAARLDAIRNALETLQGAQLTRGGTARSLLDGDASLRSSIEGRLRFVQSVRTHYFSDGGVSLDIEVPLDQLPAGLAADLQVPKGASPLKGVPAGQAAPVAGALEAGNGIVVQVAQGEAAVLHNDAPAAYERATADALRRAVELAVGMRVTSTTETRDFRTRMDRVMTHSIGFVKKSEILHRGIDHDTAQVTVRAFISTAELDKDLEGMGLLLARKNMPRTMVLIAEQLIGMAAPAAPWMPGAGPAASTDLRLAETVVLDGLRAGGFAQLVDPEIAEEKAVSIGGLTSELTASQARRLGSLTHAEIVVAGRAVATSRGPAPEELGEGFRTCSAALAGRAVNTDNGDVLATFETSQNALATDDLGCGKEAIRKAARAFTAGMIGRIASRWNDDVSSGNEVHLTVRKVTSFRQATQFREALAQAVRGVKGVSQRSFGGGTQELDVTLVGSTDDLAGELEAKKLGPFSVKVTAATANTLDVELELGQE